MSDSKALMKVPDWIDITDNSGKDGFSVEDVILPRILLAQKLSPQMDSDQDAYIEGLKLGEIFNSVTEKIFRVKRKSDKKIISKLSFAVIKAMKPRYAIFDSDGKQVAYDVGAKDKRTQWRGNKKPIAQKVYDYLIFVLNTKELAILQMKVTNILTARNMNTQLSAAKGPIYSSYFDLTTHLEIEGKKRWYKWVVSPRGYLPTQELHEECAMHYEQMKGADRVRTDADADDDSEDNNESSAPDQGDDDVIDTTAEDVTDENSDDSDDGDDDSGEDGIDIDLTEDDLPF